jgi:exodeoxyribonuclease III
MKIATWNINSLKVRLGHVLDWLAQSGVDVVCLQELKLTDDKFPTAELAAAGFASVFTGQKTYNGVAILVRDTLPIDDATVSKNIPGFEDP